MWYGLKHRKQSSQLTKIVDIGLGDDDLDMHTKYNRKREDGLDTNSTEMSSR